MLHPSESKFQHGCRARHNHIAHRNPRRENSEYRGQYGNAGGCVTEVNSVHVTSYTFTVHPHQPENRIQDARSKNGMSYECAPHTTQSARALSRPAVSLRGAHVQRSDTRFIYVHTGHNLSSLASCSPTLQATGPGSTFRTLSTQYEDQRFLFLPSAFAPLPSVLDDADPWLSSRKVLSSSRN